MERIYVFIDVPRPLTEEELNLILEFFPDDDGYCEESFEDFESFFRYEFIADFYSVELEEGTDDTYELAYERVACVCRRLNWITPYCFKINDGSTFGAYVE